MTSRETLYYVWKLKGALGNTFFPLNFHLSCKNWLLNYKYKKKISQIPSKREEIINFCSGSGDESNFIDVALRHGYSKPKCHYLQNVQFSFVSVQRSAQTNFRIRLQSRIMVPGAKFNSHDFAGHFISRLLKMTATRKKITYLCN